MIEELEAIQKRSRGTAAVSVADLEHLRFDVM
jgi:hypothetical protein